MISRSGPALMKLMAAPVPRFPQPTSPARNFFPFGAPLRMGGSPNASLLISFLQEERMAQALAIPIPANAPAPKNFLLLIFLELFSMMLFF